MSGMAAIVTGAFILPMNSKKDFKFSNYYNASCAFAIVAAIGTTGYSFVDDIGMNMLKIVPNPAPGWIRALLYLLLECLFTAFWLQIIMLLTPQASAKFRAGWRHLVKPGLIAGLAIGTTYGIVLLAMTHTQNVSYIVALRQLSIPIGTLLGVVILKEQGSWPRFVGVTILFLGLVLVAVG
jgi:drug/metabolite transporter (DMT)-like permease